MKMQFNLSVPYTDAQPMTIILASLPSDIDIIAPYFRGIRPRDCNLFEKSLRQSDRLNESEKFKWMIRWLHGEDPNEH